MRSISFRFIIIFVILVLVTAVIFGALFMRFLHKYDLDVITGRVDGLSRLIIPKLKKYDDLNAAKEDISTYIELQSSLGFGQQIFVISKNEIIATASASSGKFAEDILDKELLIKGETGQVASKINVFPSSNRSGRSFDKIYPVVKNSIQLGCLYIKYDLKDADASSENSIRIIVESLALSLSLSLILAVFIGTSITKPINQVTKQASKMAFGNFNDKLIVRSDDEIGKLSNTFNYMADRLSSSLDDLYREKNKMEAIVNNIGDGIIAVDHDGKIIHINPQAEIMLFNLDMYKSFNYQDLAKGFDNELSFDSLINMARPDDFKTHLAQDGYYYNVRLEHFYDERGKREGFILVFQDVTKEASLENMRRDFIANVSHELKTPITSIKSYSETMIETKDIDEDTRNSFLAVINTEADRMGRLVNDLLQLSSMDSGKVELFLESYTWNSLVTNVVGKLRVQLDKKQLTLKVNESRADIVSAFDYDRMEQVITNLITNSIKYTKEGGVISVSLSDDDKNVYVSVKDSGIGIAPEHLEHLFSRFYRVDKSRERARGGSGLGLSIVKQMLDLHSADIEVQSVPNEGTEFSVRIPKVI